jgi:hypothetical protein
MKRVLLGLAMLLAACRAGDAGTTGAGTLTVRLTGGTGNEGAVLVIVSGGSVASVDVPVGSQVATNTDGAGTHIMVMGSLAVGAIATLHVPDLSQASRYVATVVQVADRTSYMLLDPMRYQVTVGQ